jgi:hypothetical protein
MSSGGGCRWSFIPLITALHVAVFTFYNSQGYVNHTWQLISMILVAQSLVVLFFAGWRAFVRKPFPFRPGIDASSCWLYFSQGAIVVGYVTSAVSKLVNSEWMWLWNTRNVPIALLRTQMQQHYSNPVSPNPPPVPPFAQWLIDHPSWAMWIFGPGLFLELFAFAALWNRVFAFWIGVALIVMHRMIAVIMDLHFELNEWAVLIFFINLPWWAWWSWMRLSRRRPSAAGDG